MPTPAPLGATWNTLRECWLALEDLPEGQMHAYLERHWDATLIGSEDLIKDFARRHAEALNALIASGELDPAVAKELDFAFTQVIIHIERGMATCYQTLPLEYHPRTDLLKQVDALAEMAKRSSLDPATVAQVQAALEEDLTELATRGQKIAAAVEDLAELGRLLDRQTAGQCDKVQGQEIPAADLLPQQDDFLKLYNAQAETAKRSSLDPATLAQVRAALEDLTDPATVAQKMAQLLAFLKRRWATRVTPQASPEAIQAIRLLIKLLLNR